MSAVRHIWIPVSNLDRSVDFYSTQLGLEKKLVLHKNDTTQGGVVKEPIAQLVTKDKNVLVMLVEKPSALPARGGAVIGFVVNNLATVLGELRMKGVEFIGDIIELDDRRFIHFRDPDGHIFQLGELSNGV